MTDDEIYGYLALKHANGMSFRDVLKLHAHKLAERIRAESQSRPYYPEHDITGTQAANLIDPEVNNG